MLSGEGATLKVQKTAGRAPNVVVSGSQPAALAKCLSSLSPPVGAAGQQAPCLGKVDLDLRLPTSEEEFQQQWAEGGPALAAALAAAQDVLAWLSGGSGQLLPGALPALLRPPLLRSLSLLVFLSLDLQAPGDLAHLSQCTFPALQELTLCSHQNLQTEHLASMAAMAAPRLRQIRLHSSSEPGDARREGVVAICLRPQPVDARGQPVPLRSPVTSSAEGPCRVSRTCWRGLNCQAVSSWLQPDVLAMAAVCGILSY